MSDQLDIDNERGWALIDQFAAGDLPDAERQWMIQWTAQTPAAAAVVQALRDVCVARDAESVVFDTMRMRERVLLPVEGVARPKVFPVVRREGVGLGSRRVRGGLWIGTLAAVIGGAVVLMTSRVGRTHPDAVHAYVTGPYQQGIINLDDGTRVVLAPQTTLRVLRFGAQARTVTLENGEAYFEVAHALGAPFVVRSGAVTARVLGTAFLVRHRANDRHVRVAVTDGKVRLTTPARTDKGVTLTVGQVGDVMDSVTHVSAVDDVAPGTERAPGRIMFRFTPLTTVLQTVSQWYGFHFRYADQTLGARTVSIMISTQSSAEALAAIERVLAVNLTVVGDTVTLVPQPPRSSRTTPRIRTYDVWTPIREVGR